MDVTKLSDADLRALSENKFDAISERGLRIIAGETLPEPKEGVFAAGVGGAKRFGSTVFTGLESLIDPTGAAKRGLERSEEIGQQYAPGANLEKVKEVYAKRGLLPAAGEVISQIPGAIAEQVPNIGATLGAARLGAMAGSAFGPIGTIVGGVGGATVPSLMQLFGSNIERQAAENQDISRAKAIAAAAPGAALETAATFIPLGRSIVGKILGPQAELALTKGGSNIVDQGLARTLTQGAGVGLLAEIPTEITQQMLERLQAGLPLTSSDALAEYGQAAYGAGLVGAPFGAVGRVGQRALARGEAEEKAALEEAKRLKDEADRKAAAEAGAPLLTPDEATMGGTLAGPASVLSARAEIQEKETQERAALQSEFDDQNRVLVQEIDRLEDEASNAAKAGNTDAAIETTMRLQQMRKAQKQLEESAKKQGVKLTPFKVKELKDQKTADTYYDTETQLREKIEKAKKELVKAGDLGDFDKMTSAATKLKTLEEALAEQDQQLDLFGGTNVKRVAEAKAAEEKRIEFEGRRSLYNTALLMLGKRAERDTEGKEQQSIEKRQEEGLRKLEFGLDNLGVSPLGIKGEARVTTETDLLKGLISPELAKKLDLFTAEENRLTEKYNAAKNKAEREAVDAEIDALNVKIASGVFTPLRAVDVLDSIEAAWQEASKKQEEIATKLLSGLDRFGKPITDENRIELFDKNGNLTKEGKEAVVNEVRLATLTKLRNLGRESKETLESRAAEDRFSKAYEEQIAAKEKAERDTGIARAGKMADFASQKLLAAEDTDKSQPFSSVNEAFEALRNATIPLQRGEFLGKRKDVEGDYPRFEEERAADLSKKIQNIKNQIAGIRGRVRQVGKKFVLEKPLSPGAKTRIATLEGRLRKLEAGLSDYQERGKATYDMLVERAEKAAAYMVDRLAKQIEAASLVKNRVPMSPEEAASVREVLQGKFDEFIGRVKAAERVVFKTIKEAELDEKGRVIKAAVKEPIKGPMERRRFEKLGTAFTILRREVEDTVKQAIGEPITGEVEQLPVERGQKPDVTAKRIRGNSKIEKIADQIEVLDRKIEEAKQPNVPVLEGLIAQANATKAKIASVKRMLDIKDVKEFPDLYENDPVIGFYLSNADALPNLIQNLKDTEAQIAEEKAVGKKLADIKKVRADKVKERDAVVAAAGEKREADNQKAKDAANIVKNIDAELKVVSAQLQAAKKDLASAKEATTPLATAMQTALQKQVDTLTAKETQLKVDRSVSEKLAAEYKESDLERTRIVEATKLAISATQREINATVDSLRTNGVKLRGYRARGETEKITATEQYMKDARARLDSLRAKNKEAVETLKAYGVETGRKFSPGFILDTIEANKGKNLDDVETDPTDVKERLERIKKEQKKLNELLEERNQFDALMMAKAEPLIRQWQALTLAPQNRFVIETRRVLAEKILEFGKQVRWQSFNDKIVDIQKELRVLTGAQRVEKADEKTAQFSPYEIQLAADFLMSRIDGILARTKDAETARKDFEADQKVRIQSGLGLPGERITFERGTTARSVTRPKPKAQYEQEIKDAQAELDKLTAERNAIAEANKKAGVPVKTPEWNAANGKVKKASNFLKGISKLEDFAVPVVTREKLFASNMDVQDAGIQRIAKAIDFGPEPKISAEETANDVVAYAKEQVTKREQELAAVDPLNKSGITKAKGALTRARNLLSNAVANAARVSAIDTPENIVTELQRLKAIQAEVEGLFDNAEAAELAVPVTLRKKIAKVEGKRKGKGAAFDVLAETDTGFADQQDILDVIEYKRDMLDPRIGDAATELIDTEAANKRLESAKRNAKAKGIEFDYYDSVADLPKPILEALGRQGLDTQASRLKGGVFNGRVFVVIQNHNDLVDLERTLAHELVGHFTVDGMLGAQGLLDLLKRVNKTLGINKLAEKLGLSEQAASTYQSTMSFYNAEIQSGAMSVAEAQEKANVNILRELIAYTMEKRVDASFLEKAKIWIQELVGAVRAWLKSVGFMDSSSFSTNDLFYLMKQARANFAEGKPQIYKTEGDNYIALRGGKAKATPGYSGFGGPNIIAKQSKAAGIAKADGLGLNFRTQLIDQRAAVDAAITRGLDKNLVDATKASDALYFMRMADNRNDLVSKSITMGTVSLVDLKDKKGNVQRTYKSTGTSLADVFKPLKSVKIGNEAFVSDAFSKYLVAYRVITGKLGADVVDIKGRVTDADLRRWLADGERIPQFVEARKLYNQYNKGLIQLNVQAGAMSKELGDKLSKLENYVPLYREVNGNVEMFLGNEQPVRLGDLKNQPYLKELVGGDELIIDVFASSVRNTQMLTNMALTNMATRNVAFALQQIGIAKIHKGKGSATGNILRYKKDGDDFFVLIDTQAKKDIFGDIPDKLIVQGMEGIQVTLPWVIRALSYPTNLLKKMITRDPRYAVRQIFRESMATYMTAGTDSRHLMSSMTSIGRVLAGKDKTYTDLQRAGVLTGNVTSGTPEEVAKRLEHLAYGRSGWVDKGLAGLDALAMAGEGSTKISLFESFIRQGLSERDAYFATLEAANMTRRGLSPSAYYANMLIPFFNAGVQGIDVLYRALSGKMTYDEKLKVQRKLIMRGVLMAGMTAAYAFMMSDDEAYKNAPPEQRYANWFIRIPGVSEPFRVPIPFEVGLLFKAIPEGIWNGLTTEEKGIDIAKDLAAQILRSLPGNITETGIPIPAGAKPIVELAANVSFFTGRDIVDARMEGVDKAFQYRDKTPELLKVLGPVFQAVNLSPAQVEHLIRGYTGSLGIGILSMSNAAFSSDVVGPVSKRITDVPIAGGLFQPNDAGRVIDDAYENMREINRRTQTYKELIKNGRQDEAKTYLQENISDIGLASFAGTFRQRMGELTKAERAIKAAGESQMSPDKKREELDKIRKMKIDYAAQFKKVREQTERRTSP